MELLVCMRDVLGCSAVPLPFLPLPGCHNLNLLLQPEAAEQRITARAAQLQLVHIWHRREVLGLHRHHLRFRPSCRMSKSGSSCLNVTLLQGRGKKGMLKAGW